MPDAGIVPSAQADGKVRQLAGGTRAASLTHRCVKPHPERLGGGLPLVESKVALRFY